MGTGIGVALSVMEGQPDPWKRLWDSFERSLRADPKVGKGWVSKRDGDVPRTIKTYREGGKVFHRFLIETGHDLDPKTITKPVVEDFIAKLRETAKDSTVHTRQAALRRFFNWLVDEEIIEKSPLAKIKMGKPDENSPDVLEDEEIVALVAACKGKEFEDYRDLALVRVALDTGMRRAELAAMPNDEGILESGSYTFVGKGNHKRTVHLGNKAIRDLDRYLREREKHPSARLPNLWLAQKGALSPDGVHHILFRRSKLAGIKPRGPHALRHTFAHKLKLEGVSEEDLMRLGGWRDVKSMHRYGNSAADERAREVARKHSLSDRF